MSNMEISCKVLGHSDGPPCKVCKKPMDTLRIESKGNLQGRKGAYCYRCGNKGIQVP